MGIQLGRRLFFSTLVAVPALAFAGVNRAQAQVVAIGASNTAGSGIGRHRGGVSQSEAYPAQLEKLLRARGLNVTVKNAGVPGDTTVGMMARLDSVISSGTRVVIIQGGGNDVRRGGSTADAQRNVAEMTRKLQNRGIRVVVVRNILTMVPQSSRDPDGQHFDANGHAMVAARILPQVVAGLRH
jgi:acyl-CoA thioesterase I